MNCCHRGHVERGKYVCALEAPHLVEKCVL